MLLADALSRYPSRAFGEIKLDMRVNYISQMATSKKAYSADGQGVLGLQRPALYR